MATGQVLFQRFYYSKSFVRHAMETTAMGCVCLASKIEEAPRRIRDVINVFQKFNKSLDDNPFENFPRNNYHLYLHLLQRLGFVLTRSSPTLYQELVRGKLKKSGL